MLLQNNRSMSYFCLLLWVSLLSVSISGTVLAVGVRNITGSLNLSATVNNRPAFSPVLWRINLTESGVSRLVRKFSQHAATVELAPGEYQITLVVGDKRESRTITIVENKQHNLVIDVRQSH